MKAKERERERKKVIEFEVFSLCPFFSLCVVGVCLLALPLLLSRLLRALCFNWKDKSWLWILSLLPPFSLPSPPSHYVVVCRGSHGNIEPIQSETKGGEEHGPVLYDLWGALTWADMEHGVGLQLWGQATHMETETHICLDYAFHITYNIILLVLSMNAFRAETIVLVIFKAQIFAGFTFLNVRIWGFSLL